MKLDENKLGWRAGAVLVTGRCVRCKEADAFCLPLDFVAEHWTSIEPLCQSCHVEWSKEAQGAP
jgi:hypothetical protein